MTPLHRQSTAERQNGARCRDGLIQALRRPEAYTHPVGPVGLCETHISWVLLTGDFAYKIKKPVDFGFLDFSTLDKRRFCCQEEVRLNRRFAEQLYLGVVPITGSAAQPRMGGSGTAIEYAVKMRQFDNDQLLDRIATRGGLDAALVDEMAEVIGGFHERTARAAPASAWGDPDDIHRWFQENIDHIRPLLDAGGSARQLQRLEAWGKDEWRRRADSMRRRRQRGFVRECHGDLHLGNLVRIEGRVTLFDCIEFNPYLRWIDVISEVAFLYMDLLHRGLGQLAHRFLNRYLQHTGDYQGLAVLRYYLVYRALVRAKVAILRLAQETDVDERRRTLADYQAYADLAGRCIAQGRPALLITHGFSGCGKSTLAAQLAERLGAVQIRSDIERKRLFGYRAVERTGSGVGEGIYTRDAGRLTYERLLELAAAVVEAGLTVIVDATFLKRAQRRPFRDLAARSGIPLRILDVRASPAELRHRIDTRRRLSRDPSEATMRVLEKQMRDADPLLAEEGDVTVIDTSHGIDWRKLMAELPHDSLC